MNSTINNIKNILWAAAIALCLFVLIIGILITSFNKFRGIREDFTPVIGGAVSVSDSSLGQTSQPGASYGNLKKLGATSNAGDEYLASLTFVCDSSFINLRELGLVGAHQVWGTSGGSLSMTDITNDLIKYPNDGSEISIVNAAMVARPKTLVLMLGMDGLTRIDEATFISNYETLINDIRLTSPSTQIICCSPSSISETYTGGDYTTDLVAAATEWVQKVCIRTGSYYLDVAESVGESFQMLAKYSASNGRSLNRLGLQTALEYIQKHALQE